jgi:hypothetical protein
MSHGRSSTLIERRSDVISTVEQTTPDPYRAGDTLPAGRRYRRSVFAVTVFLGLTAVWVVFFRPQTLGGPVAYVEVNTTQMAPTIPKGDLVAVEKQSTYKIGDLILYRLPAAHPGTGLTIISRIAWGNGVTGFIIKSDNVSAPDAFRPRSADIVGKVWFHFKRSLLLPLIAAFAVAFVSLVIAAWPAKRS